MRYLVPQETGQSDRQLVDYVLGLLPEDQAERLDEESIADDAIAARLRIVEDDLVDDYVRGRLEGVTLARFESHYLSSPRRRARVRFAEGFLRAIDRVAPPVEVDVEDRPVPDAIAATDAPLHDREVVSRPVLRLVAAAALLVCAIGAFLFERQRITRAVDVPGGDRIAAVPPPTAIRPALPQPFPQPPLADEPVGRPPSWKTRPAKSPQSVAIVLLPQTRAIDSVPTLALAPDAAHASFELRLESNDYSRYRAGLKDPATNQIVWLSGWIAAKSSGGQATVAVLVPADRLKPQHYSLDLIAQGTTGADEVVGSYAFRIVER